MDNQKIEIHLRYEGPDVDDGSMSIADIIPILQGFSSAYGKIANIEDPKSTHRIRITGVRPGSADIVLEVWKFLGENAPAIGAATALITGGAYIVMKIMGIIKIKRHVKKQPFKENISNTNIINITNSENVSIEMPLDIYETFKNKLIDSDINKMVQPLEKDHIDIAKLSARNPEGELMEERITAEERPYFETEQVTTAITKETWLNVKLNSLTKSTNSGWVYLSNGSRVFYSYVGDDPIKLYKLFSYQGPVGVYCVAHMDENLIVNKLEIRDLERTQNDLFNSKSDRSN